VPQGDSYLRGIRSGIPQTGLGTLLYRPWPAAMRTGTAVGDMAEYCTAALPTGLGEARDNLYLVPQGSVVVGRI
jgi:hypothetical protein